MECRQKNQDFVNLKVLYEASGQPMIFNEMVQCICQETSSIIAVHKDFIDINQEEQCLQDQQTMYIVHTKPQHASTSASVPTAPRSVVIENFCGDVMATGSAGPDAQIPEAATSSQSSSRHQDFDFSDTDDVEVEGEGRGTDVTPKIDWPQNVVKFLIRKYNTYDELKKKKLIKSKEEIFNKISRDLQEKKFKATPEQVRNKWKTMTRSYKRMVDNNRKSGRKRMDCSFKNELSGVLAKDPSVNPPLTADAGGIKEWQTALDEEKAISDTEEVPVNAELPEAGKEEPKKTKSSNTVKVLEAMREDMEIRAAEREKERKKRHDDKMAREDVRNRLLERKVALMENIHKKALGEI